MTLFIILELKGIFKLQINKYFSISRHFFNIGKTLYWSLVKYSNGHQKQLSILKISGMCYIIMSIDKVWYDNLKHFFEGKFGKNFGFKGLCDHIYLYYTQVQMLSINSLDRSLKLD